MKKIASYMSLLLMALVFVACNDDFAQPPVVLPEGGLGTGQWDDPYRTSQLANGGKGNGIWVTGYIVGWIDTSGDNFAMDEKTCTFNANATLTSNILMAVNPNETDWQKCVPVALTGDARDALNLQDNPENLGKQVTLKCNNERYFSNNGGIKSITLYNFGPVGIKEKPAIYQSDFASGDACGFTFEDGTLPAGLNFVWKVDTRYGIVASGYYSGSRYQTDAWAISPEIDLNGYTSAEVNWRWAGNYFTTRENLLNMTGAYIRVEGGEWSKIEGITYPEGTSFTYVSSGDVDLTEYVGKKIQIGFNYQSTSTIAGTLEVDSFVVTGEKAE
ncbi:MAG: DUF6359 domain-containing protein [Prevotella sp.]|nr:DUF6359 domain-containing protein [Bacteroides sp.]MCM1366384.1 DUF6359 domain-containing protein [Prevotella sp.]MCM1436687.1 DUF6359 domain-containing protein [Prevotella sp.]